MKQQAHRREDSPPRTIDEQDDAEIHRALQSIRIWLGIFIVGLILSGITAFPIAFELRHLVGFLSSGPMRALSQSTHLLPWIERVNEGVQNTDARYPFLAYGTDWLAFAHLVIALAFIGPWIEPRRKNGSSTSV